MEIKRDRYLKKIISFMWDGQVKVITGIRRCGKSYLLRNLFKSYLLGEGVTEDHILSFELDLTRDIRYRNPLELAAHVREIVEHSADQFYLFVDEIQMSDEVPNPYNPDGKKITFYDALNDLKSMSVSFAVRRITGICGVCSLISRSSVRPLPSGSEMSSRTRDTLPVISCSLAA